MSIAGALQLYLLSKLIIMGHSHVCRFTASNSFAGVKFFTNYGYEISHYILT